MRHASRFTPFLLLALWLNACLGWSWHEAEHLRQALQPAQRMLAVTAMAEMAEMAEPGNGPSASADLPETSPDGTDPSHGACAVCLAFAHLQAAAPQPPQVPWLKGPQASQRPVERAGTVRGRRIPRPFLARAPPAGPAFAPAVPAGAA